MMSPIDETAHDATSLSPSRQSTELGYTFVSSASTSALLRESYAAYLRDLPQLLPEHAGKWVAYAGDRRLAISHSKRALYRQCIAAGHLDGEFLICGIERPRQDHLDALLEV